MYHPVVGVISRHSGQVDWSRLRASGVEGAVIKVLEGIGTVNANDPDPMYESNLNSNLSLDEPLVWAPHHRIQMRESGPLEQAEAFWTRARKIVTPTSPPRVDFEEQRGGYLPPDEGAQWLWVYVERLAELCQVPVSIYTYDGAWDSNIGVVGHDWSDVQTVIAQYIRDEDRNPIPAPTNPWEWERWLADKRQPDQPHGLPEWSGWQFNGDGNKLGPHFGMGAADCLLNVIKDEAWQDW